MNKDSFCTEIVNDITSHNRLAKTIVQFESLGVP